MIKNLGAFMLIALLAGCASEPVAITVNYLPNKDNYAPEPFITVLDAPPAGAYVSIAKLDATGAPGITESQVVNALQQKAQALGANAIIIHDESQPATSPSVTYNPAGGQYTVTPPQSQIEISGLAIHTK